jgi:hypothetical protein
MTNKRAIEILTDYQAWLSDGQPLHWSASEIALAIHFAGLEIDSVLAATILGDYHNWLEFGQPFYHTLDNLTDALNIAIETLKANQ